MDSFFLYHRVPKNMDRTILYPLNELKRISPSAYEEHVKKYAGRQALLSARIPPLDCLWNDVLHFTAVPPQDLMNALVSAGLKETDIVWNQWYKIPADLFEPSKTIALLYRRDYRRDFGLTPEARDYFPFDPSKIPEYRKIPSETIEYYKKKIAAGERPLMFHRVPHVLYKGTLDTKDLEIVEVGKK